MLRLRRTDTPPYRPSARQYQSGRNVRPSARLRSESTFEVDRAILHDEHHGLLGRKAEFLRRTVEIDAPIGHLSKRPLAHVTFGQPAGGTRQFRRCERSLLMKRLEETQPQSKTHRRHA